MFNIINFTESKAKSGYNLKLSQFIPAEDGSDGGVWESVYIYIPYPNNTNPRAQNPVTCQTDKDGNLFIRVPKARCYVPKEAQKQPPKNEEKDDFGECPF